MAGKEKGKGKAKNKGSTTRSAIFVCRVADKDGMARAQMRSGSKADEAMDLSKFTDEIRAALQNQPPGARVECEPMEAAAPGQLKIKAGAAVQAQPAAQHGGAAAGGGPQSPFDNNPYNFAEWEGSTPWPGPEGNDHATHDRWWSDRFSGVIDVTLTATTPVFVPAGTDLPTTDRTPRTFWKAADAGGRERFGIPGSSIKGPVRSLFEAWTNSRMGEVSTDQYELPIPYRRRSSTGYVALPASPGAPNRVFAKCSAVVFVRRNGLAWERKQGHNWLPWHPDGNRPVLEVEAVDPDEHNRYQALSGARFNLLWTPDHRYHGYTHLMVLVGTSRASISEQDITRREDGLGHAAYMNHKARVASIVPGPGALGTNYYLNIATEPLSARLSDLADLSPGALVFGIEDKPGHLACFGKNVNFLWPSNKAPKDLAGGFMPQSPEKMCLATADVAEATFGFAGKLEGDSHPFRGRVRFTTFWATGTPEELPRVELRALTSPTGVKLKSRVTYLPRKANGDASTYDEVDRMRGRKFYWHQRATGDGIHPAHLRTPQDPESQLPAPIHPLGTGTEFKGAVHFDNLTPMELGALLVSIEPGLLLETGPGAPRGFGWKLGKAKPRGLGSVTATTSLRLRRGAHDAYASLDAPTLDSGEARTYVSAFQKFLVGHAPGGAWNQLSFVKDLTRLLRLPGAETQIDYHAEAKAADTPGSYGWMPKFSRPGKDGTDRIAAIGDPDPNAKNDDQKKRRIGMRRARDL